MALDRLCITDLAVTVADARFMKPLDKDLIRSLAIESDVLVTVEEGSVGGFGSHVLQFLTDDGLLDNGTLRVRSMVIPDIWIEQGPQKDQVYFHRIYTLFPFDTISYYFLSFEL